MRLQPRTNLALRSAIALSLLFLASSAPGCGGDNTSGSADAGGSGAATCTPGDLKGEIGACGCIKAEGYEACPAKGPTPDCKAGKGRTTEVCGVLLETANAPLKRSTGPKEYSASGPPDLSCFRPENFKPVGQSKKVKLTGYARNFANGCEAAGATVEVWTVKRTGGPDDAMPDQKIGETQVAGGPCIEPNCKLVEVDKKCMAGNERKWRRYTIENVPTETELMIITYGPGFARIHDYNLFIPNDDPDLKGDTFTRDVRVAVESDYTLIPNTATGQPIDSDKGAIAGEIHDCGNIRLTHATVEISSPRSYRGYFTENEDSPLPDPGRKVEGTSALGLYSALNVPPGPVRIVAAGIVDGKPVSLGYFDARVEANTVTAVTLRGLRSFQAANAGK